MGLRHLENSKRHGRDLCTNRDVHTMTKPNAENKRYMWFGTQDGLNKYDGYSFTVYTQKDGLPNDAIYGIVKSMVQHARGSSGQREMADVKHWLDEAVNLVYHGTRANDA